MSKSHSLRRRLLSLVLAMVMVLGLLPATAFAADSKLTIGEASLTAPVNVEAGKTYDLDFSVPVTIDATAFTGVSNGKTKYVTLSLGFSKDSNDYSLSGGNQTDVAKIAIVGGNTAAGNTVGSVTPLGSDWSVAQSSTNNSNSVTLTVSGTLEYSTSTVPVSAAAENVTITAILENDDGTTNVTATGTASFTPTALDGTVKVVSAQNNGATVKIGGDEVTPDSGKEFPAGSQVNFTVTTTTDRAVNSVYAVYNDNQYITVEQAGDTYYFTLPEADAFTGDKTVTIHVDTVSTAKVATTTEVSLIGVGDYVTAGDVVTAEAEVLNGAAYITDAVGSIVVFTWPDGSVTTGYLDASGAARSSWTVTDDFADGLDQSGRDKQVEVKFLGNETYRRSQDSEKVTVRSRTIAPGAGAAITATPADGTAVQSMEVLTQYGLSLTAGAVVSTQDGVPVTEDTHYTVAWYEDVNGTGNWKKLDDVFAVTPANLNTQYKAVVTPTGSFTQGQFELVIGCGELKDTATAVRTNLTAGSTLLEGQELRIVANVSYDTTTPVSGGQVVFQAKLGNNSPMELGTAQVVDGQAAISVTNLPAGGYTIYAYYQGVADVFEGSNANMTVTIEDATLPTEGWSIGIGYEGKTDPTTNIKVGVANTLTIQAPDGITTGDYSVEWLVSTDAGETWALAGEGQTLTVTPPTNRYQYRAIVYPAGGYNEPASGISLTKVTADVENDKIGTTVTVTAAPNPVFDGERFVLRAGVTDDKGQAVTGGVVTFTADGFSYAAPVNAAGYAECEVLEGISADTTFTAAYSDSTGVYKAATDDVTVTVKTRQIRWSVTNGDEIAADKAEFKVGETVTLTAPVVYPLGGNQALTVGKDFYYQWQYSTDYNEAEGDYTATWLNFSAPVVENSDGRSVRVVIGDENTAFRVIAVPYGDYQFPAGGVISQPICGGAEKITPEVTVAVRSQAHSGDIYEGDEITITATVKTADGEPVDEGYVAFMTSVNGGGNLTIGVAKLASNGVATFTYTAYADRMDTVTVNYLGTSKYNAVWNTSEEVEVLSTEISCQTGITGTFQVGQEIEVALPAIVNAQSETLTLGEDYYLEWYVDNGSGWAELQDAKYNEDGTALLFTPENEGTKLACVAMPKGVYNLPEGGVACGVISGAEKIATTTDLAADSTWYEGGTVTLTATVEADGKAVLDGVVEFYVDTKTTDSTLFATATLNKNGEAVVTYTLPVYGAEWVKFYAYYRGTQVYEVSNSGWTGQNNLNSATITWGADPAITIRDETGPVTDVQVGEAYTLTAPAVYELGSDKELTCGTHFYYVWAYSEDDGTTWETVQSDVTAAGETLAGAVFATENGEYRVTAYPMGGSGSIYRYPATGITVSTKLDPATIDTQTTLAIGNEYAVSENDRHIYPFGRDIVLTATVSRADSAGAAYGVVTFYYKSGVGAEAVALGSMNLDPAGQATLTVPAPAAEGNGYIFYAQYEGNEMFTASDSGDDDANVAILSNAIQLVKDNEDDTAWADDVALTITDGEDNVVAEPQTGVKYTLSGVYATVDRAGKDYYNQMVAAVDVEHAKGVHPYYTYVWQKSQDGGITWTNLANESSNTLKDVVFDSDQTMYRLAAFPVADSGWIAPASGVYSDAVGVNTQATQTTITVTDEAGNVIENGAYAFEGSTVKVIVHVSGVAERLDGTKGKVTLTVNRFQSGGPDASPVEIVDNVKEVDDAGNAIFTITLPEYSYNLSELSNQVNFFAEFEGDDYFSASSVQWKNYLNLNSAAITWGPANEDAFDKDIIIYKGTNTSDDSAILGEGETMKANETYTLVLPDVYSGKLWNDGNRDSTVLKEGVHYTVQWQYRPMGETTGEWRVLDGASDNSYVVRNDEGEELYSYRAVVTPMGDYKFAMDETFGTLTDTNTLTTNPTDDTVLAETNTQLVVTGTVDEADGVDIAGQKPFAGLSTGGTGSHRTQYEGESVTLTATVTTADGGVVNGGNVYFYRYVDGRNDVLLNEVAAVVDTNGVATLENVTTSQWDDDKTVTDNVDRYYAIYEGTVVYEGSSSKGVDTEGNVTGLQDVYIRSTAIDIPRISSSVNGKLEGTDTAYNSTTNTLNLVGLPAATTITFTLIENSGSADMGYSVTATDGRWLTNGEDYTIQWYREEKSVEQGGAETGVNAAIDGATGVTYTKEASTQYQKYSVKLTAVGHMKEDAMSKQAIIETKQTPVVDLDPGYTFVLDDSVETLPYVTRYSGAHYGDEVTMTVTVQGAEDTSALPTGTVTFYYYVLDGTKHVWTAMGDPVKLEALDTTDNRYTATASYTFDSDELPFNVNYVAAVYSGDDNYDPVDGRMGALPAADAVGAKRQFKLWSVQISNPAGEDVTLDGSYVPDYWDPACYPDQKVYDRAGDVSIEIYEFDETEADWKGDKFDGTDLIANSTYTLEVQDVYTKSGEKLDLAQDNSSDYTVEWFKSVDGGLTWSPLPETEYTHLDAKTIAVTPETKDYKYMVKVTTTNSFYNEDRSSLEDFEYSEENVDTILQTVSVSVTAVAEEPVNGTAYWVYQANPITLFATVTPTSSGEPSGHVEFYYGLAIDGSAAKNYSEVTEWVPVKSNTESGTNIAELVKTTSGTDLDGKMVAQLTTSNLPVAEDGTYSQLVIKAVYTGDQTYQKSDNINGTESISSDVVTVFSSKIRQDVENISNKVLTWNGDTWTSSTGVTGDLDDGVIITAKKLTSDGTKTVITLNPVYTLDVMDKTEDIFTTPDDLSFIYTLEAGVDYTVEWQYCENYVAYKEYLDDPATYDKNWMTVDNASLSSDFCTVEQVQGYAYRAVITPKDTAKAQQSFRDNDKIYSNILVVGDAEARLLTNIRKASSASANGDTVYIDAIAMGGTTTPVGSATVTVVEKRTGETVYTATQYLVNGWTTFVWEDVVPGEYTITTTLTGNNGYVADPNVQDYIVRFTSVEQTGDAGVPGVLTLNVTDKTVVYNGQVQMMGAADISFTGFGDYTDWEQMAKESVTFQYFDEAGNRVAEPTDAGTYTVKAYLPESMYWGYVEAEGTFTISQRQVDIVDVTAQAKVYDGTSQVNIQAVELEQSDIDAQTGLPAGSTGVVEGDSLYVSATGKLSGVGAGIQTLSLADIALAGPDADNYKVANSYTEKFQVTRNQLYGDAVDTITAAPGYQITGEDFYLIDQSGARIYNPVVTYFYHTGNDIQAVDNTNGEGKYTVLISMDEDNYKGGLTLTLYIQKGAATVKTGDVDQTAVSALVDITDTYHVYDGTAKSVTAKATTGTVTSVEYAGADGQYTATQPTDAGRYMVKVVASGQTYYGIMTIVKGEPQFAISADDHVYDGSRWNGGLTADYVNGVLKGANQGWNLNGEPVYGSTYFTYVGGSIVGYDYNAPRYVSYELTGAYDDSVTNGGYGTYMVTAHYPETANTVAVTASAEYEITKAQLTITGDDIYTRRFDTHSKLTATYEGFEGTGEYGADSELRDLIALPTFKLGDNDILSNADMTHVGNLTIYLSDANARNYTITYVDGTASINAAPTQDQLAIRGEPSTIYYGDQFQLFLYGSSIRHEDNTVQVNEASAVFWESSDESIAKVDDNGNVTIYGVGEFTITATRGDDPDTQISVSETYTAHKRYNDVVIAREDVAYDNQAHSIPGENYTFYIMKHGTRFETTDPLSVAHCTVTGQPQTESGQYPVTVSKITSQKNVGDGAGLLVIHRVNTTVTAEPFEKDYGEEFTFPTTGVARYDAQPIVDGDNLSHVLAHGRVEADFRFNSDAGSYEILIAGGTEGRNYNVSYAPYEAVEKAEDSDQDFDIKPIELTFTVGSLAGTEGQTKQWRDMADSDVLSGLFTNLPNAQFENEGDRVFGERNQVLDYVIEGLIDGDTLADLWDYDREDANFAQLNEKYDLSAEAAANRKLDGTTAITHEVGTLDHVKMEADIDNDDYIITGQTDARNYTVKYVNGRQDVTQREAQIDHTTVVVPAGTAQEDLMTIIGPQLAITGLAVNLDHDYRDLLLSIVGTVNTDAGAGTQEVKLTCGNTNYVLNGGGDITIDVLIGTVTANGYFIIKTVDRTVLRLQRTIEPEDGEAYVEPATGITDLALTITDRDDGEVLVDSVVMSEIKSGDAGWDSSWNGSQYAYYELEHDSLQGHRVVYTLEATGYSFWYYNN